MSRNTQPALIYILSDVRSGSTILDLTLGKHPQIQSIGELHFLKEFFEKNQPCTCGQPFNNCEFWGKIAKKLDIPEQKISNSEVALRLPSSFWAKVRFCLQLYFGKKSVTHHPENQAIIQKSWQVIEEVQSEKQVKFVLESSKLPERASFYHHHANGRGVKFIFLIRDGRATSYSKMVRGDRSAFQSAFNWFLVNTNLLIFRATLPAEQKISIRYEDFCHQPEQELEKIFQFLDLDTQSDLLQRPISDAHNVGGSPHRYDIVSEYSLKEDLRWKTGLKKWDYLKVFCATFPINLISGYLFKSINFWKIIPEKK